MNSEKLELIKRLANEATEAEQRVNMLGMVNIANKDFSERKRIQEEYAIARAELEEANFKLDQAIKTPPAEE